MPWSPPPDILFPLHDASETLPINYDFIYVPDEFDPPGLVYATSWIGQAPDNVSLYADGAGVHVSGPNVEGLFIIDVRYLLNRVPGSVNRWNLLPPTAEEIYLFVAPGSTTTTTTFSARVMAGPDIWSEAVYTIQVTTDYTAGRNRLVAEVAARS